MNFDLCSANLVTCVRWLATKTGGHEYVKSYCSFISSPVARIGHNPYTLHVANARNMFLVPSNRICALNWQQLNHGKCALRCSAWLPNVHSDSVSILQMCTPNQCVSSKCALRFSAYLPNVHSDSVRIFQMCTPNQCVSPKYALRISAYLPNVHSHSALIFQMCTPTQYISSKCALQFSAYLLNVHSNSLRIFQICNLMYCISSKYSATIHWEEQTLPPLRCIHSACEKLLSWYLPSLHFLMKEIQQFNFPLAVESDVKQTAI